ncbi:MAG: ATPase [Edaphobacter sp.]|nr:ATPase [Edaphobacter sp.]
MDDKTTRKYIGILEQLFLVHRVSPWFRNELKRLIKTPKLHFVDSGLLAALLAMTAEQIAKNRSTFGAVLETFVFAEVIKQTTWSDAGYHYRDKDQDEQGALVGIGVKASATVHASDFKGMRKEAVGHLW